VNILVLGPQGSGKGTQASRLADEHGLAHIATGDMLRGAIAAGTELGRKVAPLLESGQLVPDDVMVALIRERLGDDDARDGFVLDGFPRTTAQAEALDAMLADAGRGLDIVLLLQVPDEVGVERMLRRAREEGRPDDTPEVIAERLATYHRETAPLAERYRTHGRLVPIHGDRTIGEVADEIERALEHLEVRGPAR
jgi:adenylate kinase